jgi:uncharacterized protein (DUF1810 family)
MSILGLKTMIDEYNLRRFVLAQDSVYGDAIAMLWRGSMCTDQMDLIFPRLALARESAVVEPYAITSLDEASAYLSSPLLGGRYRECVRALQRHADLRVRVAFGDVDARKLHASLTLFSAASDDEFLLETLFDVWFDGVLDEATMNSIRGIAG